MIWPQDSRDHVTDAEMTQKKRIRRCWKRTCEKKFFKVCRKIVQSSKEKKELVSAIEAPNCKRFKKLWQQLMRWGVAHTWAMKWRVKPGHYVALSPENLCAKKTQELRGPNTLWTRATNPWQDNAISLNPTTLLWCGILWKSNTPVRRSFNVWNCLKWQRTYFRHSYSTRYSQVEHIKSVKMTT